MATVPDYKANDFQRRGAKIAPAPDQIDFRGVGSVGETIANTSKKREYDAAVLKGAKAQLASKSKTPLTQDSGWFGANEDEGFKVGAQVANGIQKRDELFAASAELEQQYQFDPDGYTQALEAKRAEILDGVTDITQFTQLESQYSSILNSGRGSIEANVLKQDRANQYQTMTSEYQKLYDQIQAETEAAGALSPQTKAKAQDFLNAAAAAQMSAEQRAAWQTAFNQASDDGIVVNGYKNAADKDAYFKDLLNGTGQFAGVGIDKRKAGITTINGFMQVEKAETAAKVQVIGDMLDDAIEVSSKGETPADYASIVAQASKHPELAHKLEKLGVNMAVMGDAKVLEKADDDTLSATIAEINGLIAKDGATPAQVRIRDKAEALLKENTASDNRLEIAQSRRVVQLTPADPLGGLASVSDRVAQVASARALYGSDKVSMYTDTEWKSMTDSYANGDMTSRMAVMDNIAQLPAREYGDALRRVAKNNPQMALVLSMKTSDKKGAQDTATKIMLGGDYLKNNPTIVEKKTDTKREIVNQVREFVGPDPDGKLTAMLSESAWNIMGYEMSNGKSNVTATDVVNGLFGTDDIPEINGQKIVPFEFGQSSDDATRLWDGLKDDTLRAMTNDGTLPVDNMGDKHHEIDAEFIKDNATLVYAGPGKYYVEVPMAKGAINEDEQALYGDSGRFKLMDASTGQAFVLNYDTLKYPPDVSEMQRLRAKLAKPDDVNLPRGVRNNNPGNLRKGDDWLGLSGKQADSDFAVFDRPEDGIRALAKNLLTYQNKYGINTVSGIINKWAPPNENDSNAYANTVAYTMGVKANDPISMDRATLLKLTKAIMKYENGGDFYKDNVITAGVDAALNGGA